jgi:hypothetical protein
MTRNGDDRSGWSRCQPLHHLGAGHDPESREIRPLCRVQRESVGFFSSMGAPMYGWGRSEIDAMRAPSDCPTFIVGRVLFGPLGSLVFPLSALLPLSYPLLPMVVLLLLLTILHAPEQGCFRVLPPFVPH